MTRGPHIATITGGTWYTFDPRVEDVRLEDARALAYVPRFLGHAGAAYSPIHHMVLGAEWLQEQGADGATVRDYLGHDIHEAWPPGDVPAPVKRGDNPVAVALRSWEQQVIAVVRPALGLPLVMSDLVDLADKTMFATEVRDLNPLWPGDHDWGPMLPPWARRITSDLIWSPQEAWQRWLAWWHMVEGAK